jgi:aryl-alcohol dehydrogenase-like predicted oxidoreductase
MTSAIASATTAKQVDDLIGAVTLQLGPDAVAELARAGAAA